MKKLLCIDGNSILNRQFYGIRYLSTKDGFPTNAVFGFVNVISKQLEALSPDYTAVAFDLKTPTFRHEMYGEYKAGRRPMPDDLARQLPVAKELCRAMGFTVLELAGYEADDILGTLASWAENSVEETEAYILTGDRDSLQLISDKTKVLLATNTDTVTMDDAAFFEKYGVHADQYVDVKALMGDSSDNIPGVAGVGEKTAFRLIAEEGSLDRLYERLGEIKVTPSVKAKLENGRESAYMSKNLATIRRDVPLDMALADIENKGLDRAGARELFVRYELLGALKRFGLDREESAASEGKKAAASVLELESAVLDGEFYALSLAEDKAYISDGEKIYRAEYGDLLEILRSKKIICLDCKSIYKALEKKGIYWRDCYFDVMLGAYIDDSSQSAYTAERLCATYLGETADADIPEAFYAARMWRTIEQRLEESGQAGLLYEMEMPLAAVLCDMEKAGFKIDREGIAAYGEELDGIAAALESRIFMAAGEEFNINSPKQKSDRSHVVL